MCRHQEVYYSVEVYIVGTSKAVYRRVRERVAHSRPDKVGETVISSEFLQEDTFYYAVITFETKPQNTSTIISFSETLIIQQLWHYFFLGLLFSTLLTLTMLILFITTLVKTLKIKSLLFLCSLAFSYFICRHKHCR